MSFKLEGKYESFLSFLDEWSDDKPYVVAHTSGSTGTPKEIRLLKSDMTLSARATNEFFGIEETSVLVCPLSVDYIAGKMMAVRALEADCRLWIAEPSNNLSSLAEIEDGIDLLAIVPSQIPSTVRLKREGPQIRNIIVGGSPMTEEQEKMLLQVDARCYSTFGMTETCSHVALRRIGEERYRAMPGISFAVDQDSRLIVGSNRMSFGELLTNDVVEVTDPHGFIWKGRHDNVINSGGVKLYPEEIEKKLRAVYPSRVIIFGEKDEKWGERVAAIVEDVDEAFEEAALTEKFRAALHPYSVPKKIYRLKKFPLTSTGKISRLEAIKKISTSGK